LGFITVCSALECVNDAMLPFALPAWLQQKNGAIAGIVLFLRPKLC
jgi:hypothetical protein